jgi:hypothetical protein
MTTIRDWSKRAGATRGRRVATISPTDAENGGMLDEVAAPGKDAVADRPPRLLVLRAGRIAAERGVASAALKKW